MSRYRLPRSGLLLIVILAVVGFPTISQAQDLSLQDEVVERVLDNGLKVLMVVRPETPLIRCILAYRVGAVNERPGITGISHFHEHMMFKGSYSMCVKPGMLERDQEIMAQIDEVMALIVEEESKVRGRDEQKIIDKVEGYISADGGYPIIEDGLLLGSIGVSGADQARDADVAVVAIRALPRAVP